MELHGDNKREHVERYLRWCNGTGVLNLSSPRKEEKAPKEPCTRKRGKGSSIKLRSRVGG